ncbi:MAG: hypothetical protein JST93_11835 [Acidobacteria bacterium]|nr:hypothetical protein [Acidobacteriota bacterium]
MLTIREAQLEVFRRNIDRMLLDRLAPQLLQEYPDRFLDLDSARTQAAITLRKADQSTIESESSIAELARLMVQFGNEFESFVDAAWAAAILSHKALPGDLKVSLLRQRLEPRGVVEEDEEEEESVGQGSGEVSEAG